MQKKAYTNKGIHRITQNHRMFGVRRDLCGSSSPTPLPKQGHLQQAAQDLVQAGLEYLQRRRLHSLPGQPVPVLRHPQREEVLPHVQTELPVLQFVPVAPAPADLAAVEGSVVLWPAVRCCLLQADFSMRKTQLLQGCRTQGKSQQQQGVKQRTEERTPNC